MRKAVIPLFVVLCIALSGCGGLLPSGEEIEAYDTIEVLGVDVSEEDPSQIEVSLISKAEKGSGGMTVKTFWASGPTAFEAQREVRASEDKVTFLGYVDYVLIGEKAAQEDFTKYFDYFVRDHETRFSPKVFIVRDCSVKELMNQTSSSEMFLANRLRNIVSGAGILANTAKVNVIEVMGMLDSKYAPTIIPALKCEEVKGHKINGDLPEKAVVADGYAIIKDCKLVGFIEDEAAMGYNFLTNKVESCPISVGDPGGGYVALEVIDAKTKVEAHFSGDKLEGVTYKTNITNNIPEQQSREKITTRAGTEYMSSEQSQIVKALMENVLKTSKELKADCTGLGEKIRMMHPYKWEKIKDKWTEIYPELKIDVVVESKIARTYDIILPNGYQGKD